MTQESPLVICYECQTPMKEPAAQVRGEFYCADCAPAALRRLSEENA